MIYFIRDTASGHIKVGYSAKPRARLHQMQVASPTELELLGAVSGDEVAERAMHERLAVHRVRGEWFRCEGELAELLLTLEPLATPSRKKRAASVPIDQMTPADFIYARGTAEISAILGISTQAVRMWAFRGSIPRTVWPELLEAFPDVTIKDLLGIERRAAAKADAA